MQIVKWPRCYNAYYHTKNAGSHLTLLLEKGAPPPHARIPLCLQHILLLQNCFLLSLFPQFSIVVDLFIGFLVGVDAARSSPFPRDLALFWKVEECSQRSRRQVHSHA